MVVVHGADATIEAAARALLSLGEIEWAQFAMLKPEPPCVDIPPTPPNISLPWSRDYHAPDPGLDMDCAWVYAARGQGIQIADCEFGYIQGHEDLCNINDEPNQTPNSEEWFDHGTAVLGELVALDNDYGLTGLVPDATAWFFPERSVEEGYRRSTAIANAIATVDPGDIVLLEMQTRILPPPKCSFSIMRQPW